MNNKSSYSKFVCPYKDTIYLLFGKKKCPNCGEKLVKEKKFEINVYTKYSIGGSVYRSPGGITIKDIYYEFVCGKCGYLRKIGETRTGEGFWE